MVESGRLLVVSAAPLLASTSREAPGAWAAIGSWLAQLPGWSADAHVVAFCQSLVVLVGLLGSVVLLRRLLLPDRLGWLLQSVVALALALAGRVLVAAG
jgi:hypothetical protein